MGRILCLMAAVTTMSSVALATASQAADIGVTKGHTIHSRTAQFERRHRIPRCSDPFSCFPLYGAYGPYGGVGYWSAYSYGFDYYVYR